MREEQVAVDGVQSIDPEEVTRQRLKGWPDWHPESFCHRCGHRNLWSWSVDSRLWNLAVAALDLTVAAILCPQCFAEGYRIATGWTFHWLLIREEPRS